MITRILIGVSPDADWLALASTVAPLARALSLPADLVGISPEPPNPRERTSGEVLADWYRSRGVETRMLWERGAPAACLKRLAEETPETLLVLGATAERRDASGSLGAVTLEILRGTAAHTLVVPPGGRIPGRKGAWRLVCATDFSNRALAGAEIADALAFRLDAELHLVHIVRDRRDVGVWLDEHRGVPEPPGRGSTRLDAAMQQLLAVEPPLCDAIERHVTGSRDVAAALLDDVERLDCDLIALTGRGHGRAQRALLGRVSEAVVRRADRPVLLLRPPEGTMAALSADLKGQDTVVES